MQSQSSGRSLTNSKHTNKSVVKHEYQEHAKAAKINMKVVVNKVQIKVSKLRFLKLTCNIKQQLKIRFTIWIM